MTIVFLSPRFYPDVGGVEKHAFEIAKILSKNHKVIVLTEGQKDRLEKIKNIKVIRLSFGSTSWYKKFIIWLKLIKLRKIIGKADVVHCHDVFFWYLPLRVIYPRKKVYITFHGYEGDYPPKISSIIIRKLSEKLANGNIAVGEYIEKWYGTKANFITYGARNSIKTKKLRNILNKRLKILFVGRLDEDNGVGIYLKAISELKNYKLEVLGDGRLKSEFEKFGKVHGFVRDIDRFIEKSDIIFASSYLSIIDGLSAMKPVFSVYQNLLKRDYLKSAPFSKWIYISGSSKNLINQLRKVISNGKLRENNSERAYRWVEKETWNSLTKIYLRLWSI